MNDIITLKKLNSENRIEDLTRRLSTARELNEIKGLTVFVAGSYARNEASTFSDIDLFFLLDGKLNELPSSRINSMRAFAKIIGEADELGFPAFSNDGEFLKILEKPEIKRELGGRNDDYLNYFTARMLLLLESRPVYGKAIYQEIVKDIVGTYFRDYTHHPKDFRPIFLINDIIRFWKTLCLNYENKRNQPEPDRDKIIKQKIKNFKLKFSRMLTCYGSIVAIISAGTNSGPSDIIQQMQQSPYERLKTVSLNNPGIRSDFSLLTDQYEWFLEQTNVSEQELIAKFSDKPTRETAFARSEKFGDCMFSIVREIAEETGYLRYLLI